VCPLVCKSGTRKEGDRCVAIQPKPKEKTAQAPPREGGGGGGGNMADLFYRCKSNDRGACAAICSAGGERACQKLGKMRR